MSENLDLVRSIFAAWERGDYGSTDWADPEIVFVLADGPEPGRWTGVAGLAEYWREFLQTWNDFRLGDNGSRELDDGRVLVSLLLSGRAKASGLALEQAATAIFDACDAKVIEIVYYNDRDRALADLGLEG
jgi:ketosteroid isomerase-like protein